MLINQKKVDAAFEKFKSTELDTDNFIVEVARQAFEKGVRLGVENGTQFLSPPLPLTEPKEINYNG